MIVSPFVTHFFAFDLFSSSLLLIIVKMILPYLTLGLLQVACRWRCAAQTVTLLFSSSSDVHPSQHTSHAPQLPGRLDHVLPVEGLRKLRQQRRRRHGHLAAAPHPAGRRLGGVAERTQRAAASTGTLDSGAAPNAALRPLAHGSQPAHRRRAEG